MPTQRGNTVINLPTHTPVVTATNNNQLSQSSEDSVLDSEEDNFTNQNQLLQSLEDIRMDSEKDNYVETSLPEIPIEMEPVQVINQLLKQLTTKPSNKIYPRL